jgi:hypothetical protein
VEDGVPYAIDFMNPAPDADLHSVGRESFDWIVDAVARLAVKRAQKPVRNELRWAELLNNTAARKVPAKAAAKAPAKKVSAKKIAAKKTAAKAAAVESTSV